MKQLRIYSYMCVGDDRHCLSTFVHPRRETKKTFVQGSIFTICLPYERSFEFFVYICRWPAYIYFSPECRGIKYLNRKGPSLIRKKHNNSYSFFKFCLDSCWTTPWTYALQCLDLCWTSAGQVLGLMLEICWKLCWNYAWGDHNETWCWACAIHVDITTLTLIAIAITSS